MPLLEERDLGDGTDINLRYGLDALRKRLKQTAAATLVPTPRENAGDTAQ